MTGQVGRFERGTLFFHHLALKVCVGFGCFQLQLSYSIQCDGKVC